MRKLKLQMQISLDGFVAGPNGELDWMTWQWDDKLKKFVNDLHAAVDTILLGRKMTDGFVAHWTSVVANPPADGDEAAKENFVFAKIMVDTPKVVFTKTLEKSPWANTVLAKGKLVDEIRQIKKYPGKDIIVYGGASFVAALVEKGLIDELNLFINPTAIGGGLRIFNGKTPLKLVKASAFKCGVVVLKYKPKKK